MKEISIKTIVEEYYWEEFTDTSSDNVLSRTLSAYLEYIIESSEEDYTKIRVTVEFIREE